MKNLLKLNMGALMSGVAFMPADAATTAAAPAKKERGPAPGRYTPEQVREIRQLRSLRHEEGTEKAGTPIWSHAKLAEKFDTNAGTISQIVRNRTYKDENYVPNNDGK
jgi:hypothetical protein